MDWPLYWRLPLKAEVSTDSILDRFLDYTSSKNLQLYPAQEEAILELIESKNIILNTPTGSGKSLVALALHFDSLSRGRRSFYTCPIKALVNEKFRDLCAAFGPDQVGMITGDGGVNQQAPIICCTAEILSNMALRDGEKCPVDDVVMDEFHYYSDHERGVAWQVPLLILKKTRFILMSATLGDMDFFATALTELNQKPTTIVSSQDRPVPLDFEYRETPLHETVSELIAKQLYPIYLVNFSQREAAEVAQNLLSIDFVSKDEKQKINKAIEGIPFPSSYGKEIQRFLKNGIGLHHAGLLPRYRILTEKLAQQGLLKLISGTDTLGVGVNVPIRTVLLTKLCKYDGKKTSILSARDFHQISGRAGRRGFDDRGLVVAQAPEHVIENIKIKLKANANPAKAKKMILKMPPPHGFVLWTHDTFKKLIGAKPEALVSNFQVSHSMLLNVLSRDSRSHSESACDSMRKLIQRSHGSVGNKKHLRKLTFTYFRSLYERKIIDFLPKPAGVVSNKKRIQVHVDLQKDFSLNNSLSLFLLDTLKLLDPADANYPLDLLSLVEAILESPDLILRKQLDRLKSEKMFEMKLAGIEFEERIAELDKLEHPKPNRDFIYSRFNIFSDACPWVGEENIRPKSIAREMYETFQSFDEYVRDYGLQRIEGILLRYLSEVFKVIEQTVPDVAKTDDVRAIAAYFGTMVRETDSSLIDDWQKMQSSQTLSVTPAAQGLQPDRQQDLKLVTLMIRNEIHRFLKLLSLKNYQLASEYLSISDPEQNLSWRPQELEDCLKPYYEDHQQICFDQKARAHRNTEIKTEGDICKIAQTLIDPEGHNDWIIEFELNLAKYTRENKLRLTLLNIGSIENSNLAFN
ncbi:MAG: DUF3516 domain-containing protein [Bdellovibrio sp.]|nr:DUF3516 domain-containing protein [Bdellovibrio sp.]